MNTNIINKVILILGLFLCLNARAGNSLDIHERLDSIVASANMLKTSQMGLLVYDLAADTIIYARDEHQTLRPASTMKLVTAITALDRLGTEYEYRTSLRYRGEIADSTLVGDIFLIGGMDPKISRDDLLTMAMGIKEMGIDTIRGNLITDRSMKDADLYGEGWCWDDDNAMLSPLVYKRKDDMAKHFLSALQESGVAFSGNTLNGTCPKDAKAVTDITRPMTDVLTPMMKHSNNLYAESMYYQIALTQGKPATARKAKDIEEKMLRRIGRGDAIHRFADGSGLSLYNYLSADILVAFLRYAWQHEDIFRPLYDALPIAAVDGTIKDRMTNSPAANNVHAKTGTLSGISSLAGYCTLPDGRLAAFAIINQGVMKAVYAKRLQDRICIALCSPDDNDDDNDDEKPNPDDNPNDINE